MKEITGKFNSAKIFTDDIKEKSLGQVKTLCDQPFSAGAKIRLMPDIHAGAGCTIGTTMTITDKICPNLVGVDIGCGMETIVFHADSPTSRTFDPEKLDKSIGNSRTHSPTRSNGTKSAGNTTGTGRGSLSERLAAATISSRRTGTTRETPTSSSIRGAGTPGSKSRISTRRRHGGNSTRTASPTSSR